MGTLAACRPMRAAALSAEREGGLQSALYVGEVGHRRSAPAVNEFRYPLFMLYLDLAELDHVFDGRWLWAVERPAWASFRRADHLRRPGPLATAVREAVELQLGFRPAGPVRILTQLRYLGFCFNPISVYYCYGEGGTTLEAIVAEVHNTPWGEEYVRALDVRQAGRDGEWLRFELDKEFHVSPFMPMDIRYAWSFTLPGERLAIRMESEREGEKIFEARLDLSRRPPSGRDLALALLRCPFMTGRVLRGIYWQALRIRWKGVPFFPNPGPGTVRKGMHSP